MYEQIGYIVLSKDEKKVITWGRRHFMNIDSLNGSNIRVFKSINLINDFFIRSDFPNDMINEVVIKKIRLTIEEVE